MSLAEKPFAEVFRETYPLIAEDGEPARMPFQGAWPIDFWHLEATAFCDPPSGLWWDDRAVCACGKEAQMFYQGQYFCRTCFRYGQAP